MERSITPRGPFTLGSAMRFIDGWEAGRRIGADDAELPLAFLVDDWSGTAAVTLRQDPDGTVRGTIAGDGDHERAWAQALRVVSLDHDGAGYAELGERDPVLGALQHDSGFLRPVLFHSPYEGAAWAIISARLHHVQAARIRDGMSEATGGFPAPARLREIDAVPSLPDEKLRRLHAVAEAALAGELDREPLLAAGHEEAVARLTTLRGIGPFWADLVYLRAVGPTDGLTVVEPRVRAKAARAYGRPELTEDDEAWRALADTWRPFRTWATVLIRSAG